MQTALRLTTDPALRVQPDQLLKQLETSLANFDQLLKDLKCSPEDLHQTLNDPQTHGLLKLKAQLATLQLKLLAIRYIPHAFHKLIDLMNTSEKPEVARRAANTVLNIAGVATNTKPELPTAPTPQAQKEDPKLEPHPATPEEQELISAVNFVQDLKREGIDLHKLSEDHLPTLANFLQTLTTPPTNSGLPTPDVTTQRLND